MKKDCVAYGSDVSAGEFKCKDCGEIIKMSSKTSLPPCPRSSALTHLHRCWIVLSGQGDAPEDPYPDSFYNRYSRK